jgi:hypothetical protein
MLNRIRAGILRRLVTGAAVVAVPALALLPMAQVSTAATEATFTKIQGAAASAAGLQPTVDAYRALLGDPNNRNTPGSQNAGRREIDWDGTPLQFSAPNLMPPDLFNKPPVPRGAVFSNPAGNQFQVSADSASGVPVRFGNINPQYPLIFNTFSQQKLFTPLNTTTTRVRFFVPGTNTPATVNGFGAVFTDVDSSTSTKIELYDRNGTRLWWSYVLKGTTPSKSLSFLGVKTDAKIFEVRITSGNTPLSAWNNDGGAKDVVVMDDFLYGEPRP